MAIDLDDPKLQAPPQSEADPSNAGDAPDGSDDEGSADDEFDRPSLRTAVAVAFPVAAAAVMVGGIYQGPTSRIYALIAGLLGVALAFLASRFSRRPVISNVVILGGLFAIGLVMLLPNIGDMVRVSRLIQEAQKASSVLRPPVKFDPGWKAVVGWIMGIVGFTATWMAVQLRWRSAALMVPLPIAAIAAISVPEAAQVASGIVVLVLFAIGLGLMSAEQAGGGDDGENKPSLGYEIRKALKALPVLALITGALIGLAQTDFLFPDPVFDPAQEAQKPKTQPLSAADDKVLFEIKDSELTGPFRMGSLDVYVAEDGSWRLPPFAASELTEVAKSGIVDEELKDRQELQATFVVRGLAGAVLPALPNTVGIAAVGPRLAWDARNGNIRVINGSVNPTFEYTVTAGGLPTVDELKAIDLSQGLPKEFGEFTRIPDPPSEVQALIDQAPQTSSWEKFDWLRKWILDNVTAKGTGTPVDIKPARVADMIAGEKTGSPFEIVAAQAMLARWVGIPSRIGYGFDGGEKVGEVLQIRPRHGAAFVEVWFPGYKWLPVIGTPKKAEPTVDSDPNKQQFDPNIIPSNDITAQLYLPTVVPPRSVIAKQIGLLILLALPIVGLIAAVYFTWPALKKARRRAKLRQRAADSGPRARVALAYAEWRDYATDFGYSHPADTPLMFLERFADDEEHTELAWLTTRVLWGDLRDSATDTMASAAEELSRSLRRRLGATQAATMRAVALVSRLSLRHPYVAEQPKRSQHNRGIRRSRRTHERETVPA